MDCLIFKLKSEVNNNNLPLYFPTYKSDDEVVTSGNIKVVQKYNYVPKGNYLIYVGTDTALPRIEEDYFGLRYVVGDEIIVQPNLFKNQNKIYMQAHFDSDITVETYLRLYVNTRNVEYSVLFKYFYNDIPFQNIENQVTIVENPGINELQRFHIGLPVGEYQYTISRETEIEADGYISINSLETDTGIYGSGKKFDHDSTVCSRTFIVDETMPCYVRLYISSNLNIEYTLSLIKIG